MTQDDHNQPAPKPGERFIFQTTAPERYLQQHNGKTVKMVTEVTDRDDPADALHWVNVGGDDIIYAYRHELFPVPATPAWAAQAQEGDVFLVIDLATKSTVEVLATRALAEDYAQRIYSLMGQHWSQHARISHRAIITH